MKKPSPLTASAALAAVDYAAGLERAPGFARTDFLAGATWQAQHAPEPCSGCGARIGAHIDGCPVAWSEYAKRDAPASGMFKFTPPPGWLDNVAEAEADAEPKPAEPAADERPAREFWIDPKNWQVYFKPREGRIHVREVKK